MDFVSNVERKILQLIVEAPQEFAAIRDEITEGDDLRPNTVLMLTAKLVKAGLVNRLEDDRYTATNAGRAVLTSGGNTAFPAIFKAVPGNCPAQRKQNMERQIVFGFHNFGNLPLSMELVTLRSGEESTPHAHIGTHTVVYHVSGRVLIRFGTNLELVEEVGPGEAVYIPPNVPHHVSNLWPETVVAVVARSSPHHLVAEYNFPNAG